jgi:hypothetical protein
MTALYQLYTRFIWIILITVVASFWFSVFSFAFNFPFYDDFENIVQFIHQLRQSNGIVPKMVLLFNQNFEHRVLFSKLITLSQYLLTGQVNIKWLIVVGDLSLLGIAGLFYTGYRNGKLSLPALLAICCLLFQIQHYEDTISWATCSLQHAPCIFFSLWSFYLAFRKNKLYTSALLAVIALFTSANGLAAIFIWIIIAWTGNPNRRNALWPTLLLGTVTLIHLVTLTIHSGSLFDHAGSNIGPKFVLLLSFAGQVADSDLFDRTYSVILGIITTFPILIAAVQLIRRKPKAISHLQWTCVSGICALLFVGFLIVFARGAEPDETGYQMDRYKIYAALFVVLAVGFYDAYWGRFKVGFLARSVLAGIALLFCASTYYLYYGDVRNYRSAIEANQFNFKWSRQIYYPLIYQDSLSKEYLEEAQKSYLKNTIPSPDAPVLQIDWKNIVDSLIVQRSEDAESIALRNGTFREANGYDQLYVAALRAGDLLPQYLMKVENGYHPALRQYLTSLVRPVSDGFGCLIFKKKMKQGMYDIRLVSLKKGRAARVYKLLKIEI